jgi:hypothetical protein
MHMPYPPAAAAPGNGFHQGNDAHYMSHVAPPPSVHHYPPPNYEAAAAALTSQHPYATNDYHHNEGAPLPPYMTNPRDSADDEEGRGDDDDDDDDGNDVVYPMSNVPKKEPRVAASDGDKDDEDAVVDQATPSLAARGKPEAMARALAAVTAESTRDELEKQSTEEKATDAKPAAKPKPKPKPKPKKKATTTSSPKKKKSKATSSPTDFSSNVPRTELILEEKPAPITKEEYENLEALMVQFCRVPLLAEFSRPVSLLHPEVSLWLVLKSLSTVAKI